MWTTTSFKGFLAIFWSFMEISLIYMHDITRLAIKLMLVVGNVNTIPTEEGNVKHYGIIIILLYIYLKYSLFKHKQWNACGALKWQPWKLHAMLAILLGSFLSTCVKGMSFKGSVVIIQQFPGAVPYCTIFLFF